MYPLPEWYANTGQRPLFQLVETDDVALLANSTEGLQTLLDICGKWAEERHMSFSAAKTQVFSLPKERVGEGSCRATPPGTTWRLCGGEISLEVKRQEFLGIRV